MLTTGMAPAYTVELSEGALLAWQESLMAYTSQISTFWPDRRIMFDSIAGYAASGDGTRLWGIQD